MKHLRKFSNLAAKEAATIYRPCVSFIEDTMDVIYHPLYYFNPRYLYTDGSTSTTLDSSKTVMGVEVIPASHMSDGKARFVSVKNMSRFAGEVETGSTAIGNDAANGGANIIWGRANENVNELTNYTNFGYKLKTDEEAVTSDNPYGFINELSETISSTAVTDFNNGYPGSDYPFFSGAYLPFNSISLMSRDNPLPYPFNSDGSKNMLYWNNGEGMAITDMEGANNTNILRTRTKVTWSEGDELNTNTNVINHPAAIACYRFHGGKPDTAGHWYLPAAGELGYLWANVAKINAKIAALDPSAGVKIGVLDTLTEPTNSLGCDLLSSTERNENIEYTLSTENGGISFFRKDYVGAFIRVRAFLAV